MAKENYTVRYVTPDKGADVWALMEMLEEYGATGISADGRETVATWPTQQHECQFETACEQEING